MKYSKSSSSSCLLASFLTCDSQHFDHSFIVSLSHKFLHPHTFLLQVNPV